ncbi:MAG TPA: transglycosylase SLT domain-containing protein [Terriglobales bacterium]
MVLGVCLAGAFAAGCRTQPAPQPAQPRAAVRRAPPAAPAPAAPLPPPVAAPPPPGARGPSRPAAPAPDPTAVLIQSLEQQYAAALGLYNVGQLDEARAGFDATVDRLLAANLDIPASPRLQRELDSLVDRIHALESDVLPAGGLTLAQAQTTPLDRTPELTFPIDAATRAEIEKESRAALASAANSAGEELPLVLNDAVIRYLHYFTTKGRDDFIDGYRRAGRYRAMADRIFAQEGVPSDLLYMAQLESGFDPQLGNSAGARGMWQFMPARADDYDLKRTHWVDERDNPELATRAAARHLKDLHAEFGDWLLAMAAYNAGPGDVERAVARTGYADFWKLSDLGALPRLTRDYVPIVIATALIAKNPAQYGFSGLQVDSPVAVDRVALEHALDLRLAAECARVTLADIQHLNPSLLRYEAPAGFTLKLPQGSGAAFQRALATVPAGDRINWRVHWAEAGETWTQLANRYHVSLTRLIAANGVPVRAGQSDPPRPGTPVALPLGGATAPAAASPRRSKKH